MSFPDRSENLAWDLADMAPFGLKTLEDSRLDLLQRTPGLLAVATTYTLIDSDHIREVLRVKPDRKLTGKAGSRLGSVAVF